MSEGLPALVQIEINLAETITAIEAAVQRIKDRKAQQVDNFFADLRDELEVIENAVNRLDQTFVALVAAYADEDIINNPAILKELGRITRNYLEQQNILPSFEHSIGVIQGLAFDPKVIVYHQLGKALTELSPRLDTYRSRLGLTGWTGVGLDVLKELLRHAGTNNWAPDDQTKQTILDRAEYALLNYPLELSGEIRRYLGQAQFYARANIPHRRGLFGH